MSQTDVDVLIIGAGISGVGAACHLTRDCPSLTYTILERRQDIGGTWDLFKYPGIRSDSDMFTFGYSFRPWVDTRTLADGPSIKAYVDATAAEYGVREHVRFGVQVTKASWSSVQGRWTLHTLDEATGEPGTVTATYVMTCTGYYNYDEGFRPEFPGQADFGGQLIHPQHWPEDLDYDGKRVVIIGSGATAVTLVPSMTERAAHVTMLQRSPSYILPLPAVDLIAAAMKKVLPDSVVSKVTRVRNIAMQRGLFALARSRPRVFKAMITKIAEHMLGGSTDLRHFTPSYEPWDQRLCIVPDGDLFRVLRAGDADIVTDTIDTFTETSIRLVSGAELKADIIVSATGLQVQMLGGAQIEIDGEPLRLAEAVTYKGVLIEGVPNAVLVFGYTNASWTLKADLACEYACRLFNHMRVAGYGRFVVHATDADRGSDSMLGSLTSGYVSRGNNSLPRQGTHGPWLVRNNYLRDAPMLRRGTIDDGVLEFSREPAAALATVDRRQQPRPTAV